MRAPDVRDAITLAGVHKHYGAVHAVDGVDLAIRPGELFGLIGHNGAGKSTLFKMMLGLIAPTAGEIRIAGTPVGGAHFREVRQRVGYLPENVVLWDNLSGLETLAFFARLKGVDRAACAPVLERVGLGQAGQRAVREYSKGMRQRLGFAQALLGTPQVLLLDEPTTGLDPQAIREFHRTLADLRAQGVTIVLSSHILAELQERVDRVGVMAAGKLCALGSVAALREAAGLPLTVTLRLGDADLDAARAAMLPLGLCAEPMPGGLRLACPRVQKMALLRALAPLGARLADLQFTEPSLEDVFFAPASSAQEVPA